MASSPMAIRMRFEPLRSLIFDTIIETYAKVGTPTTHPARKIIITNDTDKTLIFSFDGSTDHCAVISHDSWDGDITTNKTREQGFYLAQGEQLWVRSIDDMSYPMSGYVYFTVMYGAE
jgi:hypothetical protein